MHSFDVVHDDEELFALLFRIQQAVKAAKRDDVLEEFTIIRQLPHRQPGEPLVQFIEGVVPCGFNFLQSGRMESRKHKRPTAKKSKIRKRLNRRP